MKKFNTQDSPLSRFRTLCLIMLMVVIGGCSSIKLAYNNSDTLLYWWIDGYVDLDSEQADWVRQDIDELLLWHRKTQLKSYVQLLSKAQGRLGGNVSHTELKADYRDIMGHAKGLALKALPELADLARSVKPEQIASIENKFRTNNEKYIKKSINGNQEKLQRQRYKKSMEQFELWFGNFSRDQETALRKASDARPLENRIWLAERVLRQQSILLVLRKVQQEKLSKPATMALLEELINTMFARAQAPERKAFFDASLDGTTHMILTALQIATPAQKAHARTRMQGWIDDFNTLAAAK